MNKHTYIAHTRTAKDGRTLRGLLRAYGITPTLETQIGDWGRVRFRATVEQARDLRNAFRAFRTLKTLTEALS